MSAGRAGLLVSWFPNVATATQTCYACPEQYEGTLTDGQHWYFRFRHGVASLSVGEERRQADVGRDGQGIFGEDETLRKTFGDLLGQHLGRERPQWQITVRVPADLPSVDRTSLFEVVSDAAHLWAVGRPDEFDPWVYACPASEEGGT